MVSNAIADAFKLKLERRRTATLRHSISQNGGGKAAIPGLR
jgi:hypothetical protein